MDSLSKKVLALSHANTYQEDGETGLSLPPLPSWCLSESMGMPRINGVCPPPDVWSIVWMRWSSIHENSLFSLYLFLCPVTWPLQGPLCLEGTWEVVHWELANPSSPFFLIPNHESMSSDLSVESEGSDSVRKRIKWTLTDHRRELELSLCWADFPKTWLSSC